MISMFFSERDTNEICYSLARPKFSISERPRFPLPTIQNGDHQSMKNYTFMGTLCGVILLLAFSTVAGATVLTPLPSGTTTPIAATTETGTLVAGSTVSGNYNLGTGATGTVTEAVYRETGGTLDFVYQFTNTSLTDGIGELSVSNFATWLTGVGYQTAAMGPFSISQGTDPNPSSASRTGVVANPLGGTTVDFNFSPTEACSGATCTTPAESAILIVGTNATTISSGFVSIIDGGSQTLMGFESPAPEPRYYGVFLVLGLAMASVVTKYRRKKQDA